MNKERYREFGKTREKIFPLGLGTMRLARPEREKQIAASNAVSLIRYAIDQGIHYIDTAYNYMDGLSETVVGEALKEGYRGRALLATKSPVWLLQNEYDFSDYLEKQLKRLHTDYIDFYLLHGLDGHLWENKVLKFQALRGLEQAKRDGKIRYFGFSFHDELPVFRKILNCGFPWDFCQIQLNYLDTGFQAGLQGMHEAYLKNIGVSVMEPLRGGLLAHLEPSLEKMLENAGKKPVGFALDYLWDFPEISVVLSGMQSKAEIDANIKFAFNHKPLKTQEKEIIGVIKRKLYLFGEIPCTGCGYCAECPGSIPISDVFAAYNDYQRKKNRERLRYLLEQCKMKGGRGKLSCIGCGYCNRRCPQKINVMSGVKMVMDFYQELQG